MAAASAEPGDCGRDCALTLASCQGTLGFASYWTTIVPAVARLDIADELPR